MRVPDEAGEGKAQVKVSFPALKAFKVADTTGFIMIKKAESAEATAPEPAPAAPKGEAPAAPKPAEQPHGAPPAK